MIYLFYGILTVYSLFVLLLDNGIRKLKFRIANSPSPATDFSILIAFRNEADMLPRLLKSLAALKYPRRKMEIIFIDDHSNDQSVQVISAFMAENPEFDIKILKNKADSLSPKKEAISLAIQKSSYPWVITTDADCQVVNSWLDTFDAFIQNNEAEMLAAPVSYLAKGSYLDNFQWLDFISLQGTTMGLFGLDYQYFTRPILCNGANLCYKKSLFEKVGGFGGNREIASGDDIFLLEKVVNKFPKSVKFVKSIDCLVLTDPKENLGDLVSQRLRWASKTKASRHPFAKLTGILVFLTNLSLVISFILSVLGVLSWMHFGLLFLVKFNIDFILLYRTAQFLKAEQALKSYFLTAVFHPIFTVFIFILSLGSGYKWKDRNYK